MISLQDRQKQILQDLQDRQEQILQDRQDLQDLQDRQEQILQDLQNHQEQILQDLQNQILQDYLKNDLFKLKGEKKLYKHRTIETGEDNILIWQQTEL